MSIYEKVTIEILSHLDKLNNDEDFKKNNSGITPQEFLCARVNPDISPKRLFNILNGKAKRITIKELCIICWALNIELKELFKNIE